MEERARTKRSRDDKTIGKSIRIVSRRYERYEEPRRIHILTWNRREGEKKKKAG